MSLVTGKLSSPIAAKMQDFGHIFSKARPKMPFPINIGKLNPIPHRYRRARRRQGRSVQDRQHSITGLTTSFSPLDTFQIISNHRWTIYDVQHILLLGFASFSLAISGMAVWLKIVFTALMTVLFLVPITSQFFWPGAAIWTYLLYFFSSRFIPVASRPHIWVKVLPALENVLYGANLSGILSAHQHSVLDILAWIPYGILHFSLPFFISAILFVYAAPGTTPVWARAFGWMNIMGVTIQLVFPCTPPWYETKHGLDTPAYYGMEGDPAGLARIDNLFHADMYTTAFTKAPLPFGAFPSLHAGNATIEALFLSYCFPRLRPLCIAYVCWVWWATMYLSHHYAVDLVGGSLLAAICFFYVRAYWVPRPQPDKKSRWDYEYVERGESNRPAHDDRPLPYYNLENLRTIRRSSSDEWTLGSSSGFSTSSESRSGSGAQSPSGGFEDRGWDSDTSNTSPVPGSSRSSTSDLHEVVVR